MIQGRGCTKRNRPMVFFHSQFRSFEVRSENRHVKNDGFQELFVTGPTESKLVSQRLRMERNGVATLLSTDRFARRVRLLCARNPLGTVVGQTRRFATRYRIHARHVWPRGARFIDRFSSSGANQCIQRTLLGGENPLGHNRQCQSQPHPRRIHLHLKRQRTCESRRRVCDDTQSIAARFTRFVRSESSKGSETNLRPLRQPCQPG
jgi:hypothetical protein